MKGWLPHLASVPSLVTLAEQSNQAGQQLRRHSAVSTGQVTLGCSLALQRMHFAKVWQHAQPMTSPRTWKTTGAREHASSHIQVGATRDGRRLSSHDRHLENGQTDANLSHQGLVPGARHTKGVSGGLAFRPNGFAGDPKHPIAHASSTFFLVCGVQTCLQGKQARDL